MKEENLIRFCLISRKGIPYDIVENSIAEYLIENHNIMILVGKPYIYRNGVFKSDEHGIYIQYLIKQLILPKLRSDSRIMRVYKLILKDYRLQVEISQTNNYPKYWINFLNGMLDIKTGILHQHSPTYRSVNQIPHNYKPGLNIEKSVFNKFLLSRIPDEDNRKMLYEYMGYCLLPDVIFQKFLILVGMGNAGKSVILNQQSKILGAENLAAVPLQSLSERFTTASLLNKQCNVCGDLSNAAIKDTSVLKQLTGEDLCKGEIKGGAIFFFKNRAKFLFSCNELPAILDDRSNGFYRRLLIIRFEQEGDFIPDLYEQLSDENEIEIIISHIVRGAKEALDRGKLFESGANLGEVSRLQEDSDSVASFFNNVVVQDESSRVRRPDLYAAYLDYCKQEERISLGKTAFFKAVRTKGYRESKVQGNIYVCGIKLDFMSIDSTPFDD